MDIRHLQTFVAVAELRHFARAASLCNLSQPAVSHQIAQLEAEIGVRLLNRAGRRVSLTVAGEVMLEEARRVLAAMDRARERLQEVARGTVGRIRLGASATPGLYLLPPVLATYRRRHPDYELRLEIGPVHEIAEKVARNDLDMALVAGPPPTDELRARRLAADELVIVTARDETGGRTGPVHVKAKQVESLCWILREEGSDTRKQVLTWWHRHHLAPSRTMTFEGPDAVKRAVLARLGIAMVSRLTVSDELARRELAERPVKPPLPVRDIHLIDHPQKHHGAACRAMLALLGERFKMGNVREH